MSLRRGVGGVAACLFAGLMLGVSSVASTVEDDAVKETPRPAVVVEQKDVRIATLLPFAADQLLAMGVKPVCVPGLRGDTSPAWEEIPTIQMDHSAGPNLEQLIAVEPDYIVTASVYAQFMPQIESITKAKIVFMDVDSIEVAMTCMAKLGEISGRTEKAAEMVKAVRERLLEPSKVKDADRIKVLAIFGTPHSFYAFMPESYLGDLVKHGGGRIGPDGLVSHKIYKGLAPLSMETVIDYNPDLLLVLFHGTEETARAMFEGDPLWGSLNAVHENRMFFLSDDLYAMRPGSKLDLAISQVHEYVANVSSRLQ
ncbi:MAG: ABC transporter substrate-binding protein [Planctomycetota bacterium]|nr:ABC transporter substrate-binding protein [Planctomycetota bacterium]